MMHLNRFTPSTSRRQYATRITPASCVAMPFTINAYVGVKKRRKKKITQPPCIAKNKHGGRVTRSKTHQPRAVTKLLF